MLLILFFKAMIKRPCFFIFILVLFSTCFLSCSETSDENTRIVSPVTNLLAETTSDENEIVLSWANPNNPDLKQVQITYKINTGSSETTLYVDVKNGQKVSYTLIVPEYGEYKISLVAIIESGAKSIPTSIVASPKEPDNFWKSSFLGKADTLMTSFINRYLGGEYGVWNSSFPNATGPYWGGAAAVWGQGGAYSAFTTIYKASLNHTNDIEKYKKYETRLLTSLDQFRNTNNGNSSEAYGTYLGNTDERYYDDNEWIGIDMTEMYMLTNESRYLDRALMVWNFVLEGFDDVMGGGIYWKEGVTSKHTCSTAPAAVMAAKLYQATKEEQYLEYAKKLYAWCKNVLQDPNDYLYWDNVRLSDSNNPESSLEISTAKYSYNSGQPMQAASLLFQITGEEQYLVDAKNIAESAYNKWFSDYTSSVLNDTFKLLEPTGGDGLWFHAIMFRGFAELYTIYPERKYITSFDKSLTNAWLSNARNKTTNLLSGDFSGRTQENSWPLIQEGACVEMLARLSMIQEVEHNLTE